MRYYVTQNHPDSEGHWALCADGALVTAFSHPHPTAEQSQAVRALCETDPQWASIVADAGQLVAWESDAIALVDVESSDGRQLDAGGGSFRQFPLPLLIQTEMSWGHDGAVICGRIDAASEGSGVVPASGVFDSGDEGMEAARLVGNQMLDRVSVDLGAIDYFEEIVEQDDDGWPTNWLLHFVKWEVMGATICAHSAFADCRLRLSDASVAASAAQLTITAATPLPALATKISAPPRDWFYTPEPEVGERFALGSLGDDWLVQQDRAGHLAMPLTITEDRRVLCHLAYWGQEHTGFPGRRVTPPNSPSAYAHYHVGYVVDEDGASIPTGCLTVGCDHAAADLRAPEATSHYAHAGLAWADGRIVDGRYGPWFSGVLRPDVTAEQVRVLRAGALSGDWRSFDGRLELIAALAVNTPGFSIAREAITAAAFHQFQDAVVAHAVDDSYGSPVSLTAAGVVQRCSECAKRALLAASQSTDLESRLSALERTVEVHGATIKELAPDAAEKIFARRDRSTR